MFYVEMYKLYEYIKKTKITNPYHRRVGNLMVGMDRFTELYFSYPFKKLIIVLKEFAKTLCINGFEISDDLNHIASYLKMKF